MHIFLEHARNKKKCSPLRLKNPNNRKENIVMFIRCQNEIMQKLLLLLDLMEYAQTYQNLGRKR